MNTSIKLYADRQLRLAKKNSLLQAAQAGLLSKKQAKAAGLSALNRKARQAAAAKLDSNLGLTKKFVNLQDWQNSINNCVKAVVIGTIDLRTKAGRKARSIAAASATKIKKQLSAMMRAYLSGNWSWKKGSRVVKEMILEFLDYGTIMDAINKVILKIAKLTAVVSSGDRCLVEIAETHKNMWVLSNLHII